MSAELLVEVDLPLALPKQSLLQEHFPKYPNSALNSA